MTVLLSLLQNEPFTLYMIENKRKELSMFDLRLAEGWSHSHICQWNNSPQVTVNHNQNENDFIIYLSAWRDWL